MFALALRSRAKKKAIDWFNAPVQIEAVLWAKQNYDPLVLCMRQRSSRPAKALKASAFRRIEQSSGL